MSGRDRYERKGSMSLEAVLVLPMVLFLAFFMMSQILAVITEIKVSGALDKTASEFALIGPAVSLLREPIDSTRLGDKLQEATQEVDTLTDMILPEAGLDALASSVPGDAASTAIIGPFVMCRIMYWLDQTHIGSGLVDGFSLCPGPGTLDLFLDWQIDQQQLWICVTWETHALIGVQKHTLHQVVPLWIGSEKEEEDTSGQLPGSVWMLDNFSRGQTIRTWFGGDLPHDFPVIAEFYDGAATSIKSLDVTAPTYASRDAFSRKVTSCIDQLSDFSGARYQKGGVSIHISENEICQRQLVLVMPENGTRTWLERELANLTAHARDKGVFFHVVRSGTSERFTQSEP
jgi:hypothetical protein